jgi:hypothetical protein
MPYDGGQTALSDSGYAMGPPELVVEVASSRESIDLSAKRHDYERAGVLEYVVVVICQRVVRWFVWQHGQYQERQADADGIFKSAVFPGLWLQQTALVQFDWSHPNIPCLYSNFNHAESHRPKRTPLGPVGGPKPVTTRS